MASETKKVITGNQATSYGAMLARVETVAAYPITPQTSVIETIAEMTSDGRLAADLIRVESEHSAMAACVGASAAGVRTFTATSSQGLLLMHEMLHYAAASRLPIVMTNINRAVAPPWNIWTDQTDSLAQRETGWIQLYCEDNQEVLDTTIMAFKIAETIELPVMLVLDAFFLSHTAEAVTIPDSDKVDKFVGKYRPEWYLNPDDPRAFGALGRPDMYMELRLHMQQAMMRAKKLIADVDAEYGKIFGRKYGIVEPIQCEDADIILVTTGTIASTCRDAIDELRAQGEKVGQLKVKAFRPFPHEAIREATKNCKKLAVLDRNFSPGSEGIWAQEIRAGMYSLPADQRPEIFGYILGLGGRDITVDTLKEIYSLTKEHDAPWEQDIWIGVNDAESAI